MGCSLAYLGVVQETLNLSLYGGSSIVRELTGHKVNGCNSDLNILVCDEAGHGGANHHYQIIDVSRQNVDYDDRVLMDIEFQNGPIKEAGVNGITHEALIAVVIDRLECFQKGAYACADNQEALDALRKAQTALQRRTVERVKRGVEGTHTV